MSVHHADEFSAEDANRLHIYISTFTVAGLAVGILLVVGAMRLRKRNIRARHMRLSSVSSNNEGPDQATPVAAPSMEADDDHTEVAENNPGALAICVRTASGSIDDGSALL
ncbi:hypothetical protein DYB34_001264 [Aphanomyces astaci]|uniref:Uncharacterized protein n=1 Tax=Aphanomyces astaci TaxID=112090 RepID=A0A397AM11_APHAT|nr:hypothetical protein DYB36_002869 [Aphanomyces astaci]RHY58276.1 hypothetical protein DYB34_001264 [Aphanomyces astaci]RHZ21566.1 hypothetical protein DYB31_008314 [Aphanomyces astaci]